MATREQTAVEQLHEMLPDLQEIRDDIANGVIETQNDNDAASHDAAMAVQYVENLLTDAFGEMS